MLQLVEAETELDRCWKTDSKDSNGKKTECLSSRVVVDFFFLLHLSILFVGMEIVWE